MEPNGSILYYFPHFYLLQELECYHLTLQDKAVYLRSSHPYRTSKAEHPQVKLQKAKI
jgi:hypothetical protein